MNILILGGHGFIGHHVAKQLIDLDNKVFIVDIHHNYNEYQDWEFYPVLNQRMSFIGIHQYWKYDVLDSPKLESVFEKTQPDIVIDLATYPNAKMVKKNVVDATMNMVAATAVALDLCVKYNVKRFVLASSSMVYGDFGGTTPDENFPCNPLTLYGSYKLQCERMCQIWNKEHGLEYSILRPSALYGTRDMVVRVVSKMTVSAYTSKKIYVNGPNNKLDFSFVTDVSAAFVQAALHKSAANEIFNCTRGNGRTILEAAEIIAAILPSEIVVQPHDDFYPNRDTLKSNKLQNLTDWKPCVDIEQGIPMYTDWFLSQNFLNRF
jgi:nucleoside-diphosphate-sugar epimerase